MAINIRYLSNINGIPRLESNSVSVNTENVVFAFTNPGTRFNNEFNGLVLLKFNQVIPTGTTGTACAWLRGPSWSGGLGKWKSHRTPPPPCCGRWGS